MASSYDADSVFVQDTNVMVYGCCHLYRARTKSWWFLVQTTSRTTGDQQTWMDPVRASGENWQKSCSKNRLLSCLSRDLRRAQQVHRPQRHNAFDAQFDGDQMSTLRVCTGLSIVGGRFHDDVRTRSAVANHTSISYSWLVFGRIYCIPLVKTVRIYIFTCAYLFSMTSFGLDPNIRCHFQYKPEKSDVHGYAVPNCVRHFNGSHQNLLCSCAVQMFVGDFMCAHVHIRNHDLWVPHFSLNPINISIEIDIIPNFHPSYNLLVSGRYHKRPGEDDDHHSLRAILVNWSYSSASLLCIHHESIWFVYRHFNANFGHGVPI